MLKWWLFGLWSKNWWGNFWMNLGYFLFQHLVTLLGIEKFLSSFSSFQCYEIVMIDGRDSNRLHLVLGAINQSTTAPSWQYLFVKLIHDPLILKSGEHSFRGKYQRTADLQFILFGFSFFAFVEWIRVLLVWSNPNQSNSSSVLHPSIMGVLC